MSRQAKVGALFLALFAILLYLAPSRSPRSTVLGNHYDFVFEHVNGLREGDNVKVAGISAGQVISIDFTTRHQRRRLGRDGRVVVRINTDYDVTIPDDSRVSVEADMSGQRWVEITPGNSEVAVAPGSVSRLRLKAARQNQLEGSLLALKEMSERTEDLRAVLQDPKFRRNMKDLASNSRFYTNEFRSMSGNLDDQMTAFDKNLDAHEKAVLRQLARVDVQIDEARRRTETLVPRVNETITAWEARIQGSDKEIRGMMDTAVRETERFRGIASQAETRFVDGKVDETVRQEVERLATRVEEIADLASDMHGISSSPEVQAELRGMIEKYRRQAEELRRNLDRWEKAIP